MFLAGCRGAPKLLPLEPVPLPDAIGIVNGNISEIRGAARAVGWVDGSFIDDGGRKRSYSVDGVLFHLPPSYLRFDLKSFGQRRFLFGSNARHFWFYDQQNDAYQCGWHGEHDQLSEEIPIAPLELIDALGLSYIPSPEAAGGASAGADLIVQRVVDEYQQILFVGKDDEGRVVLTKEYWLDRFAPRLVRKVVFRDRDGVVQMESQLEEYEAVGGPDGPMLPGMMTAVWPASEARMRFKVGGWSLHEQIGPDGPQFATPGECE